MNEAQKALMKKIADIHNRPCVRCFARRTRMKDKKFRVYTDRYGLMHVEPLCYACGPPSKEQMAPVATPFDESET